MTLNLNSLFAKVATTVVATAALAGATTLIKTASAVSVLQAERVDDGQRLERIEKKIDQLLDRRHEPNY